MSFILDALKKSEEERRRGEMPDLRTDHATAPAARPRQMIWPALLAVVLLINALLLLWWSPWQAPVPVAAPETVSATEGAVAPIALEPLPVTSTVVAEPQPPPPPAANGLVAAGAAASPAAAEPAGWSDLRRETAVRAPKQAAPVASTRSTAVLNPRPSPSLPHLRNLPDSFRRALPDLAISLHYYDPDPRSRIVRLNGRILREGATVTEGLVVEEITAAGVILSWHGERFLAGDF